MDTSDDFIDRIFLSNDVYLVILDKPTVFHLSCKKADSEREQINPPFWFF